MAKSKATQLIKALAAIALLGGVLFFLLKLPEMLSKPASPVLFSLQESCDLNTGQCTAINDNKSIALEIAPQKIASHVPLTFSVRLTNIKAKSVVLDIQGKDMFMGINQIKLSLSPDGEIWEGVTELAVCTTNTMFWRASILAYTDETSTPDKASFEFEVK